MPDAKLRRARKWRDGVPRIATRMVGNPMDVVGRRGGWKNQLADEGRG